MAYLASIKHNHHATLQDYCFHCGHSIAYPAVHRVGVAGAITLHSNCAVELSIKLLSDVNHMQHDTSRRIHL
jgi:hypothetical protein